MHKQTDKLQYFATLMRQSNKQTDLIITAPWFDCRLLWMCLPVGVSISTEAIYLTNYTSELHWVFCACCLWSHLSPPLAAVQMLCTFGFVAPWQCNPSAAALLYCCVCPETPAAWRWLCPVLDDSKGCSGGVCHVSVPYYLLFNTKIFLK